MSIAPVTTRDVQPSSVGQPSSAGRSVARYHVHTATTQSSLRLKVRTAEGDTVELSLDAQNVQEQDRGYARGPQGRIKVQQSSEQSSVSVNVKINGDLNDNELADIKTLIGQLETGKASDSSLSTLAAYKGAFTQTTSVRDAAVTLFA